MKKGLKALKDKGLLKLPSKRLAILLLGIIAAGESLGCLSKQPAPEHELIQVCFSPGGQCTQFVEQAIAAAQRSILVQAYSFTSQTIAEALIAAHERGITVKILVDRSQLTARGSKVKLMVEKGIPLSIDVVPGIAHNKVMIIDNAYVLTGSFNWTHAAEYRNAENLLFIRDENTSKVYRDQWEERAEQAQVITLIDIENAIKQEKASAQDDE